MADASQRYDAQHDRICAITTRMEMKELFFELRDKPDWVTFKVFGNDHVGRLTMSVDELEQTTDAQLMTGSGKSYLCNFLLQHTYTLA
jgi:hypothetical protein